jgi:hypothetical protein
VNKPRGLSIKISGHNLKLDLLWIGLSLLLAMPAGWLLTESLVTDTSPLLQITLALVSPVVVLLGMTIHVVLMTRSGLLSHPSLRLQQVVPAGRKWISYYLPESPEAEFSRELKLILLFSVLSVACFAPLILLSPDSSARAILVPCTILGIMFGAQILPSLPFHGGYLFRSIFWFLHGDARSGTRAAFVYSQLFASAGLGFGAYFLMIGYSTLVPGIWSLFFALLLLSSSRHEIRRVNNISRASTVRAADAVAGLNPTIRAAAPLTETLDILLEQNANGPGLIRDRNVYSGVIDLSAIRAIPRSQWSQLSASDRSITFDQLVESPPGSDLLTVLRELEGNPQTIIIVRDEPGNVVGLVDETMDPGMLIRRGIARDPNRGSQGTETRKGSKTS